MVEWLLGDPDLFIRNLGEGHRYVPGMEPTVLKRLLVAIVRADLPWRHIASGLILFVGVLAIRGVLAGMRRRIMRRRRRAWLPVAGGAGPGAVPFHSGGIDYGAGGAFHPGDLSGDLPGDLNDGEIEITRIEIVRGRRGDTHRRIVRTLLRERCRSDR